MWAYHLHKFGGDLYDNQGIVQPFGYMGYQADGITGTYYAQAREYKPELGRFGAVDVVKGFAMVPYTLNEYGYCWNKPEKYVDLKGAWPSVVNTKNAIIEGIEKTFDFLLGKIESGKCIEKN